MRKTALLAFFLALQAALLLARLDWLPVWGDESFSLYAARLSWPQMAALLRGDVHPPLYFALLKVWLSLPWTCSALVAARALSAVFMLASTVALDRLWLLPLAPSRRAWVLTLWSLSACGLLYARMARSYSLQVLLVLIAARLALDALHHGGWKRWTAACAACWALLMTHYVPGIALVAALHVLHWRLWWFDLALLLASAPWLAAGAEAVQRWTGADLTRAYSFTGYALVDQVLKAAYTFVSFSTGESFSPLALAGVAAAALLTLQSLRPAQRDRTVVLLACAGLLGYLGVARWVSIPFVPARLLWLLPFVFLAWSRGSHVLLALVATANLLSLAGYWSRSGFLNQAYVVPWNEITRTIAREPREGALVLYDRYNADAVTLVETLGTGWRAEAIRPGLAPDPAVRRVWIFRSARDLSPEQVVTRTEARWCEGKARDSIEFAAYPSWLRTVAAWTTPAGLPAHAYLLTGCVAP